MENNTKNKEFRNKLYKDPHSVLNYISKDIDIIVKTNTKEITYIVINKLNNEEWLNNINAAGVLGSASTASTIGTIGTAACPSSVSSASSAGTAATLGSAKIKT